MNEVHKKLDADKFLNFAVHEDKMKNKVEKSLL
jgi:hypothetical protein